MLRHAKKLTNAKKSRSRRSTHKADRNSAILQIGFARADTVFAIVEDGSGQSRACLADGKALINVRECSHAPGSDHRHRDSFGDRARELQIIAVLGAVSVHAGEQDLARAEPRHFFRPQTSIE